MSTSSVLAVMCGAFVLAGVSGTSLTAKDDDRFDSSKFVTTGQCRVSPEGRLQFLSSRNRFAGAPGGGSYGNIFFAGGAGGRASAGGGNANRDNPTASGSSGAYSGGGAGKSGKGSGRADDERGSGQGRTRGTEASTSDKGAIGSAPSGAAYLGGASGTAAGGSGSAGPGGAGVVPSPNPEPASLLLIGAGLGGLLYARRGKRRQKP